MGKKKRRTKRKIMLRSPNYTPHSNQKKKFFFFSFCPVAVVKPKRNENKYWNHTNSRTHIQYEAIQMCIAIFIVLHKTTTKRAKPNVRRFLKEKTKSLDFCAMHSCYIVLTTAACFVKLYRRVQMRWGNHFQPSSQLILIPKKRKKTMWVSFRFQT